MARETIVQLEQRPEERFLFTAQVSPVGLSFTTDDGPQTDDQHVMEVMSGCMTGKRVFNSLKKIGNSWHCSASKIIFVSRIAENTVGNNWKISKAIALNNIKLLVILEAFFSGIGFGSIRA